MVDRNSAPILSRVVLRDGSFREYRPGDAYLSGPPTFGVTIMSRSTISTFQLFERFPNQEAARVYLEGRLFSFSKEPITLCRRFPYPCLTGSFYLIGVHSDEARRRQFFLLKHKMTEEEADDLISRDEDEDLEYGQRVTDTFHLSDFFVRLEADQDEVEQNLWRFLDVLFGHPYKTPTFDEYAMFLAFVSSMRSSSMSRQVGAVVTQKNEIVSTGANDCPQFSGGLYWPEFNKISKSIEDKAGGRDYTLGKDVNKAEQQEIIDQIIQDAADKGIDQVVLREVLEDSRIRDLTEFGRAVHAEMEALLACARNRVSSRDGTLYTTTFPCHNCAKHIIAAGIKRVVYIEPYQKSKAAEFHKDAMVVGFSDQENAVRFEPFVGFGPRHFLDFFSVQLGSGYPLKRRAEGGIAVEWKPDTAQLRLQMLPISYLDFELAASNLFKDFTQKGALPNGR